MIKLCYYGLFVSFFLMIVSAFIPFAYFMQFHYDDWWGFPVAMAVVLTQIAIGISGVCHTAGRIANHD